MLADLHGEFTKVKMRYLILIMDEKNRMCHLTPVNAANFKSPLATSTRLPMLLKICVFRLKELDNGSRQPHE